MEIVNRFIWVGKTSSRSFYHIHRTHSGAPKEAP